MTGASAIPILLRRWDCRLLPACAVSRSWSAKELSRATVQYWDRSVLGGGFTVYVAVGLSRHLKKDQEAFERAMSKAPEVRECHNVSGTIEYLLRIEVSDLEAYKFFHTEVLGTVPQVSSIVSYMVMASPKDERG